MSLFARDDGYADEGPAIIGVSVGLLAVGFILVAVRLVYRFQSSGIRTDDYLIAAAFLLSLGHSVNDCISVVYYGYGKHKVDLTPEQAQTGKTTGAAIGFFIAQLFYKSSLMCTKLSVCFLYRRIFERAKRSFNIALWAVTGLIFCYYVAVILTTIFECRPVSKSWIKTEPGQCINVTMFFYVNAAFNILTDVIVISLPIPIIYELHLPTRQKIMLCCVFAVGLCATATSIGRIFTISGTENPDTTWGVAGSVLWSSAELNTAIICACLPMLRPPLQALFPRLFRTGSSNAGYSRDRYGGTSGKWNSSNSAGRFSRRQSRRVPDPNSVTVVMDEIDERHGRFSLPKPLGQTAPSDKSSDDEPYFIDRDEDSAGILKRTDVTVVYEADIADAERRNRASSKDLEAGRRGPDSGHAHKDGSSTPGMAM